MITKARVGSVKVGNGWGGSETLGKCSERFVHRSRVLEYASRARGSSSPEDVAHVFNQSHTRWVPVPPPLRMTTVIPTRPHPSGTSEGGALPSLTGPGTTGLPPPTLMGVPQSSTTVADSTKM